MSDLIGSINTMRTQAYISKRPAQKTPVTDRRLIEDITLKAVQTAIENLDSQVVARVLGIPTIPKTRAVKGQIFGGKTETLILISAYKASIAQSTLNRVEQQNVVISSDRRGTPYAYGELVERREHHPVFDKKGDVVEYSERTPVYDDEGNIMRSSIRMTKGIMVTMQWQSTGDGWQPHVACMQRTVPTKYAEGLRTMDMDKFGTLVDAALTNPVKRMRRPTLNDAERLILEECKHLLSCGFARSQVDDIIKKHCVEFELKPNAAMRIGLWL